MEEGKSFLGRCGQRSGARIARSRVSSELQSELICLAPPTAEELDQFSTCEVRLHHKNQESVTASVEDVR